LKREREQVTVLTGLGFLDHDVEVLFIKNCILKSLRIMFRSNS